MVKMRDVKNENEKREIFMTIPIYKVKYGI